MSYFKFGTIYECVEVEGQFYKAVGLGKIGELKGDYLLISVNGKANLIKGQFTRKGIEGKIFEMPVSPSKAFVCDDNSFEWPPKDVNVINELKKLEEATPSNKPNIEFAEFLIKKAGL